MNQSSQQVSGKIRAEEPRMLKLVSKDLRKVEWLFGSSVTDVVTNDDPTVPLAIPEYP